MMAAAALGWFWGTVAAGSFTLSGPVVLGDSADAAWAAFNPLGKQIVGGASSDVAAIWDAASGAADDSLSLDSSNPDLRIRCGDFSPNGALLALGLSDGSIRIYDWKSRRLLRTLESQDEGGAREVAFSGDGAHLWSRNATSKRPIVWETGSGKLVRRAEAGNAMGVSRAELLVAVAEEKGIALYSSEGIRKSGGFGDFGGRAAALAWSPDGLRLAVALGDGEVQIRNASGKLERTFTDADAPITNLAWSSDSKYVAASSDRGEIYAWNTFQGSFAGRIHDEDTRRAALRVLAFEPGSYRILYPRVVEDASDLRLVSALGGAK